MAVPRRSNSLTRRFEFSCRGLVFADRRRTWYTFCFKQPNIILFFHILCCFPIQHLPLFSHIMLLPNDAKSMFLLTGVAESMFSNYSGLPRLFCFLFLDFWPPENSYHFYNVNFLQMLHFWPSGLPRPFCFLFLDFWPPKIPIIFVM